jgi:hypothetical protein
LGGESREDALNDAAEENTTHEPEAAEAGLGSSGSGALPKWLGVVGVPRRFALATWAAAGTLQPLFRGEGWRRHAWLPVSILVAALPLLASAGLGVPFHQPLTALLLFALFLAALRSERLGPTLGVVGAVFFTHCALAIALSAAYPQAMSECLPGGLDYWHKQQEWITTGFNDEYHVVQWLPFHVQLFAGMIVLTYLSFGLLPFYQGFYEVDLMNYYVGQLLMQSESLPTALALGWHPWSVSRGLCYLLIALVVGQWSLGRLCGRQLGSTTQRRWLWGLAVGLFALDCVLKYTVIEDVRAALQANLAG